MQGACGVFGGLPIQTRGRTHELGFSENPNPRGRTHELGFSENPNPRHGRYGLLQQLNELSKMLRRRIV
jgi:hypothetical protein